MWRPFMPQSFASFSWFFTIMSFFIYNVHMSLFQNLCYDFYITHTNMRIKMKMKNNHPKIQSALVHVTQDVIILKTPWFFSIFLHVYIFRTIEKENNFCFPSEHLINPDENLFSETMYDGAISEKSKNFMLFYFCGKLLML